MNKKVVRSILGDSKPEDCQMVEGVEVINGNKVRTQTIFDVVNNQAVGTWYYSPARFPVE